MGKSKTDIAYEIVKSNKDSVHFHALWEEVSKIAKLSSDETDDNISYFFTDLSLDGRFITLGDNVWDLRERHSFDKVHIDMNDIYSSDEVIEGEDGVIEKEDLEEALFKDDEDVKEEIKEEE